MSRSPVPWPDELPAHLPAAEFLEAVDVGDAVALGLADAPERQAHECAVLDATDDHVVIVGGSGSGSSEALLSILTVEAARRSVGELHVYAIDLSDAALAAVTALPHVGAVAVRNEGLALKIVRHIEHLVAERRSCFDLYGVTNVRDLAARGVVVPRVVLAINGADRLVPRDEHAPTPMTGSVLRVLNEAAGTGVGIWMAGGVALGHSRLASTIRRRLIMRLADPLDYGALGVPRSMAAAIDAPGRAFDLAAGRLVQLLGLATSAATPAGDVARAIGACLSHDVEHDGSDRRPGDNRPARIVDVGWPLPFERIDPAAIVPPAEVGDAVPVAVDTSSGVLEWLDATEDGPVFAIAGGSKSGRSSALLAIAELARAAGWTTVGLPASRRSLLWRPDAALDRVRHATVTGPVEVGPITGPTLVLIDDAHRLEVDDLGLREALSRDEAVAVVLAGAVDFVNRRSGFLKSLPRVRAGVALAPTGPADAAGFGLTRVPDVASSGAKPGRGLLVANGEWSEVQFPYRSTWRAAR